MWKTQNQGILPGMALDQKYLKKIIIDFTMYFSKRISNICLFQQNKKREVRHSMIHDETDLKKWYVCRQLLLFSH